MSPIFTVISCVTKEMGIILILCSLMSPIFTVISCVTKEMGIILTLLHESSKHT